MPSVPLESARGDVTRRSRPRVAAAAFSLLVGLAGAGIGYEAAGKVGQGVAVCAASRSPITVGLYVAIASSLAAWTIFGRRR
jgi:hypothetical protein